MKQKIAEHMTKKHFIKLAQYIRNAKEYGVTEFTETQIQHLANFCSIQNPAFNADRWIAYIRGECGSNGGQIKSK